MIPRYALGCWWFKNDRYNMYDINDILQKFNDIHVPISVFLLGDKWHNNIENYNYDKTLFDVTKIKKFYEDKNQIFGLTINPTLQLQQQDPLYNEK